jgi:hypothetical protein
MARLLFLSKGWDVGTLDIRTWDLIGTWDCRWKDRTSFFELDVCVRYIRFIVVSDLNFMCWTSQAHNTPTPTVFDSFSNPSSKQSHHTVQPMFP